METRKWIKHHQLQVDERSWGELPEAERRLEACAGRRAMDELAIWGVP